MVVRRKPKPLLIIIIIISGLLLISIGVCAYMSSPVNMLDKTEIEVEIPSGTGVRGIAQILADKKLIHNKAYFIAYVKLTKKDSLKASNYVLKRNMSLRKIIKVLEEGNNYNADNIQLTFKEGKRITDYVALISKTTNHTEEEIINIINDTEYLKTLITKYWFLTDDILNKNIYYPLEGYLFPDTYYFKDKDVEVETIIETMLDEMEKNINAYKDKMIVNPHNYMTLASMVELEGTNAENRKMIAGIFNNRLNIGMNLGSDVTTYYALQEAMDKDLTQAQFSTENPYNTRASSMGGKLPIGPICNVGISSIDASVNPTASDYLFFVADKNGKIYYTKTLEEHTAKVSDIKAKGDWIW